MLAGVGAGISLLLAGCGSTTHQHVEREHHAKARTHHVVRQSSSSSVMSSAVSMSKTADGSSNQAANAHLTTQQLGTLVALLKEPNWFKQYVASGDMCYSDQPEPQDNNLGLGGFDYVTANGDPTSFLYFQQQGNNVVIKYVDMDGADCVADAPIKTESVPLSTLITDYYNTKKKRDEVNGYANKLIPESKHNSQDNANN